MHGTALLHPIDLLERTGIRERMHVADLGCGALGHFIFPAAQMVGPKGMVYGVDILRDILEIVARRASERGLAQVRPLWADIDVYGSIKIPASSLDVVLLVNNLFLSQSPESLAAEIARLTKKGGNVLVVDWKTTATPVGPPVERRIAKQDARALFETPAFTLKDSFEAGPSHYGLLFQRTDAKAARPR